MSLLIELWIYAPYNIFSFTCIYSHALSKEKILWHQVFNKPIFAPKEFLQTHSPERLEWLEWFIAIMRDLKTPYVVQSILATEICSLVFTRSAESNICTLHHSNTKISLKLKRVTPFGPSLVLQYNRLYTVPQSCV